MMTNSTNNRRVRFNNTKNIIHTYPLQLGDILQQYTNILADNNDDMDFLKIVLMFKNKTTQQLDVYDYNYRLEPLGIDNAPKLTYDTRLNLLSVNGVEAINFVRKLNQEISNSSYEYFKQKNTTDNYLKINQDLTTEQHMTLLSQLDTMEKNIMNKSNSVDAYATKVLNDMPDCVALLNIIADVSTSRLNHSQNSVSVRNHKFNMLYCLESMPMFEKQQIAGKPKPDKKYIKHNSKTYLVRKDKQSKKSFIVSKNNKVYLSDIRGKYTNISSKH